MALQKVCFRGVQSVLTAEGSFTSEMQFSDCFKPRLDDVVLLMPVGWTDFNQSRAKLQVNGQTKITFTTDHLVPESSDFQLIYVQNGVACGASTPFSVGIPYDYDSLDYDSLDYDSLDAETVLVQNLATKGRTPRPDHVLDRYLETGKHQHTQNTPLQEGKGHDEKKFDVEETTEMGTVSKFERSNSELYASTDDESFVVTEMPPSHSGMRPVESDLHMMLTRLSRERDEYCKLFHREKSIAQQQEKKNQDLKCDYESTAQENNELKAKLLQTENELRTIRESLYSQGQDVTSSRENFFQVAKFAKKDELDLHHGVRESFEEEFRDIIRRPPPYCPPSGLSLSSTASLTTSNDRKLSDSVGGIESKNQRTARRETSRMSGGSLCAHETFTCPVCFMAFDDGDPNVYQRHVHSHFRDEE